jgi:hypothetical protein
MCGQDLRTTHSTRQKIIMRTSNFKHRPHHRIRDWTTQRAMSDPSAGDSVPKTSPKNEQAENLRSNSFMSGCLNKLQRGLSLLITLLFQDPWRILYHKPGCTPFSLSSSTLRTSLAFLLSFIPSCLIRVAITTSATPRRITKRASIQPGNCVGFVSIVSRKCLLRGANNNNNNNNNRTHNLAVTRNQIPSFPRQKP